MSIAERILSYRDSKRPIQDDFVVLHSSVDYDHKGKYLNYIIFDILKRDGDTESHYFKAVKLYRLIRIPNNDRIANFLMEKQSEVLASLWGAEIEFLTIVANILQPKPIGLVYSYGVQGTGSTIDAAKAEADKAFAGLTSALKGVFRTIEFRNYNYEEAEWLRKKMVSMKNLAILRGIPYPHQGTSTNAMSPAGGGRAKGDVRSQTETMEEFIAGMSDYEYVMTTVASPVDEKVLHKWLTLVSKDQSNWASIMSGAKSVSFNMSLPMMFGGNLGGSIGHNAGASHTVGASHGHVASWSDGTAQSVSHGVSHSVGAGTNVSAGHGVGTSHSAGTTVGHTIGTTHTASHSVGSATGTSHTVGNATGQSHTQSSGSTTTTGSTDGSSNNYNTSNAHSTGTSSSAGQSYASGTSSSSGTSTTNGWSDTTTGSMSGGIPMVANAGVSNALGNSSSTGHTTTQGTSSSHGYSDSTGSTSSNSQGVSTGWANTHGSTSSQGSTNSVSSGSTSTHTVSSGTTSTNSVSNGTSIAHSSSTSTSNSTTNGTSTNQSWSKGSSASTSNGTTSSTGSTTSQSQGGSNSTTNTVSNGTTTGQSTGWNLGTSSTLGMAPGISIGKSYQWKDSEVENIYNIIQYQRDRLMKSLNGQGAFFVDVMIATEEESAHHSAATISKSAFYNKEALANPLQVLEPMDKRKEHLLYHFSAFSPCVEKEMFDGNMDSYRYSTVLLSDELTAYTHPPRMSDGGLYADVEDMPQLSVPSDRQNGDIYMGHILSGQRWSEKEFMESGNGYKTPFQYSIYSTEIMHSIFQGESRSGKTVGAIRFTAGLANVIRPSGKRMRIIVFDQKDDWRKLQKLVDPDRFRFYKIDSTDELGLKINLCKIAPNVHPENHIKTLAEIFVSAYGLGILGSQIMKDGLFELYQKNGCTGPNWREKAHINSAKVTLSDLYDLINGKFQEMGRQGGNNMKDAYQRVIVRLKDYATKGMILHEIFSTPEGIGIHELLGKDDIIVLEGNGLDRVEKNFVYGMMFATIYSYGTSNGTFMAEHEYETYLIVEEANAVLIGQGGGDGNNGDNLPGQSRFESIVDQSAGNGMYVCAITQKIQDMPPSIVNSCGLWFIGRTKATKAHEIVLPAFGKNARYEYHYSKWMSRQPDLWFMVMAGRTTDFKSSAPVHVLIDLIPVGKPTDEELLTHKRMQEIDKKQKALITEAVPWI